MLPNPDLAQINSTHIHSLVDWNLVPGLKVRVEPGLELSYKTQLKIQTFRAKKSAVTVLALFHILIVTNS